MASFCCSKSFFLLSFLVSAIPIGIIISLETKLATTRSSYQYHSKGWVRECAKWDDKNNRFVVSFMDGGGLGIVNVRDDAQSDDVLEEVRVVRHEDLPGNGSCGISIDRERNRVVVAIADVLGNTYSAVAAYDLDTWERLFLTQLTGPGDDKAFADDVAVDEEGNTYITDARGAKIWKVGVNGELLSTIRSSLFPAKEWYKNLITLNGIVYHPNGYLLVTHTMTGQLFKVEIKNENRVKSVKVKFSLAIADGLQLLSPTRMVVTGFYGVVLVESLDDWETASVIGTSTVLNHRVATASTVKDGKVYINYALGMGYPKRKHVLVEAVFS